MSVMGFLKWDLKHTYGAFEEYYAGELGEAFRRQKQKRKQLVYAYGLHHEKRYEEALEPLVSLFRRCDSDEDRRAVVLGMALCLQSLGQNEKAEKLYRQILEFKPFDGTVLTNLGLILMKTCRFREAEDLLGRAVTIDAGNAKARQNLGILLFRMGFYDRAIPLLVQVMALEPKNYVVATLLARCHAARENWDEADRWADTAINLGQSPEHQEAELAHTLSAVHDPRDMAPGVAEAFFAWRQRTGKESIIGGLARTPFGRSYVGGEALGEAPLDAAGKPMRQLAAIFCEEFPGIGLPEEGLIRIFIAADEHWGMDLTAPNVQRGFRVLYDREFDRLTPGPHPGGGPFPVRGKFWLTVHTRVNQPMPACDYRFGEAFGGEPEEDLCEVINDVYHRLGGYPFSYEWDPREDGRYAHYDQLLFQLDTMPWGDLGVQIGDGGCMKFCIPSEKLAAGDVSDVLYWWD